MVDRAQLQGSVWLGISQVGMRSPQCQGVFNRVTLWPSHTVCLRNKENFEEEEEFKGGGVLATTQS